MTAIRPPQPDVVLVGAGIMSATLGMLLKELEPALNIEMFETLEGAALESSDAWNNAGTGHAANCELNYTPERSDGTIDISKALEVNAEFDLSRQLWSYLVKKGAIADPRSFIHPVPHMSFVHGPENVAFLRKRFAAMSAHHCYHGMEYTEDKRKLAEWVPLVMEGRAADQQVAATRIITGADVDYGSLTRTWWRTSQNEAGFSAHYSHQVTGLSREPGGRWRLDVKNTRSGEMHSTTTKFVFLGAGGGALPLLEKSEIPEGKGYGGFPVSGIWLRCDDPEVNKRHHAKVYGKASVGSPPMSVPHLDTRVIGGKHSILFGPYAGFSTKFLKHGSLADLFLSLRPSNIGPLLAVARDNFDLDQISDRSGAADVAPSLCGVAGVLSARQAEATGSWRWPASASRSSSRIRSAADSSSSGPNWSRGRPFADRAAGSLARCFDRGLHRARRAGADASRTN